MTYEELKSAFQKEWNEFPLGAAFSNEQFKVMMEKWGLTENDADKICSLGFGSFIRKTDKKAFKELTDSQDKREEEFLSDMKNFEDAIYYEMCNHEYGINCQGAYDVLNAIGFDCEYEHEFDCLSDEQREAYSRAKARYYKEAIEKEWF